jgi:tetratricopeptide (TPR) repeat protein
MGCSSTRPSSLWDDRFVDAQGYQDRGAYEEAELRYELLEERAPDARRRRQVRLQEALLAEERGRHERAFEAYEELWRAPPRDAFGAEAMVRWARLWRSHKNEPARAREAMRRLALRYPDTVHAEHALEYLEDDYLSRGELDALLEALESLHAEAPDSALADNILFMRARLLDTERGDESGALATYRRLYLDDPEGTMADDALWEMAQIYRRHRQWTPIVHLYRMLSADIERSWYVGVYHSEWADEARMELGRIHLLYLDDYEEAIAHFERFERDFPDSFHRDEVAFYIMEAHRLMGDEAGYRREREAFVRDYPESRYMRIIERRRIEMSSGDGGSGR